MIRRWIAVGSALSIALLAGTASSRLSVLPPGHGERSGAVIELPTISRGGGATDINQWGLITGTTDTDGGWGHAFRSWPRGPLELVPEIAHPYSHAIGINDFGNLVIHSFRADGSDGTFALIGNRVHDTGLRFAEDINNLRMVGGWTERQAAIWQRDQPLNLLLTPGMPDEDDQGIWWSAAFAGVNDRGQAAGFYVDGSQTPHAVRWEPDGTLTEIGIGTPTAINEAGDVAGWGYGTPNFLWRDASGLIAVEISALALNDAGQLAGLCGNNTSDYDACVWSEETGIIRLAKPAMGYARATAINDLGEVVGHLGERQGDGGERGHALWWYVPPDIGTQFATLQRLLQFAGDDGVLNHGRFTAACGTLRKAEGAWGAGDSARAGQHLEQLAMQLRAWRGEGRGRERLVHIEALARRLALRLPVP